MGIYDSIIKDGLSSSAIDFNEIDFKKFKLQLQSQKSSRELSGGQGTMATNTAAKSRIKIRNSNV